MSSAKYFGWSDFDEMLTTYVRLHRFQILPILQVPSITVKCIHKYRYRYMETL